MCIEDSNLAVWQKVIREKLKQDPGISLEDLTVFISCQDVGYFPTNSEINHEINKHRAKNYKIIWRSLGSDVDHTLPKKAVVTFMNNWGDKVHFWFTDNGDFCCDGLEYVNDSIKPER